ncbi:MAG: prolyl oligopeptidase family serine peptidase [Acidimicrobiia bacterium]
MAVRITPEMSIAGRELGEPRLAPDGRSLAFTVSWGGRSAIVVVPVDGGPERLVTSEPQPRAGRGLGGGCYDWLPDGSGFVYAARDGGLWRQDVGGGPPGAIVGTEGDPDRTLQAPAVSPDGRRVAYAVDMAEIWSAPLDVASAHGASAHGAAPAGDVASSHDVAQPHEAARRLSDGADFCTDPAWSPDGAVVAWHEWDCPNMAWDESRIVRVRLGANPVVELASAGVSLHVQQPRFARDGALFHLSDATGWLTVHREDRPVLDEPHEHGDPTWGAGQRSFAVSSDGRRVAICRNESGFGRLVVVDLPTGATREIARAVHGQLSWVGDTIAAVRTGGRTPTQIVTYDVAHDFARRTIAVGPVLGFGQANLPEPELTEWQGDDGSTLFGRLYRGADAGGADAGADEADRAGRLLCWLHGGPTDQWQVTFLPRLAYWVQRGWSILVPDFRGSSGHGRAYQQAMREQWGVMDVADTAASIRHAHGAGWAVPASTVVVGASAGGFTTLNVLALHPELAAGGIVLYPVTDLASLEATTHRFEAHYNRTLVGPPDVAPARYEARSPLGHAERIQVPLLVLHGDQDPVVGLGQSEALRDRIAAAGGDVELVVYEGEGHGFRQPANQIDEYRRMGEFLDRVVP